MFAFAKTSMMVAIASMTLGATAQVRDLDPPAPDTAATFSAAPAAPVDLGQDVSAEPIGEFNEPPAGRGRSVSVNSARLNAANAAAKPSKPAKTATTTLAATAKARGNIERAVFARQPIRVSLPLGKERLITLPGPAALHVPPDIESVARIESIDKTLYVTALVPFSAIRVVAELIDGSRQIPIDIVATEGTLAVAPELEIFLNDPQAGDQAAQTASLEPAADMVELTRFASRMLYAPRRLAQSSTGITQVQLSKTSVPSLLRAAMADTVPLAQWRSGDLYVTAVRVTNKSMRPLEIALEDLRGHWLAASSQHGLIGPAGSDTDTTALYLICDRAFESCL